VTSGARHRRSEGVTTETSLAQIHDTLQNLQRSVEDAGREADSVFAERRSWCDDSLRRYAERQEADDTSLRHMSVDIKEREAAVEEAEGTAFQLKADIAIVRHTLNKTMEMLRTRQGEESLVEPLVHNKQQTLAALEGEEEVILPMLAQLQASVVEMRVQLTDQDDSIAKEGQFAAALRHACSRSSERAQVQAATRAKTAAPIAAAIAALQHISAQRTMGQSLISTSASSPPEAPSFLQQGQEQASATAENDLLEVFAGHSRPEESPAPQPPAREDVETSMGTLPVPQKPKIKRLLADLHAQSHPHDDRKDWCAEEREKNECVLMLAQASVGEMEAEMAVHTDSSAHISQRLRKVESSLEGLHTVMKNVDSSFAKEKALIMGSVKDQALATRILEQAMEILEDLKASEGLSDHGEQGAENATLSLKVAEASFKAQARALTALQREVLDMAQSLSAEAKEAADALEHEQANLGLSHDSHTSGQHRCTENKAVYESDIKEAHTYLKSLQDECNLNVYALEEREREIESRALQDSEEVLEGRRPAAGHIARGPRGLRGAATPTVAKPASELSPLQRAAAEMGVAFDDN